MKKRVTIRLLILLVGPFFGIGLAFGLVDVKEMHIDTAGNTQGLAVAGYYVYLADGTEGLKIINISNRHVFTATGTMVIPGADINQVAVDGDVAVVTDTYQKVHFVDVDNKMKPTLMGSLPAQGDIPRAVAARDGMAFVVERGNQKSDPDYFSGLEIFTYKQQLQQLLLLDIPDARDVAATANLFIVAGGQTLYLYQRPGKQKVTVGLSPMATLAMPAVEEINSIVVPEDLPTRTRYLFAFGKLQLYVIDFSKPAQPVILDQHPVAGETANRRVDAACIEEFLPCSHIIVLLTTQKSYGLFQYLTKSGKLSPLPMIDLNTSSQVSMRDVYNVSKGEIQIFDAALSRYYYPGLLKGGTCAVGALGEYGMGFVQMSLSP